MNQTRKCSRCGKTFSSSSGLSKHTRASHAGYYYSVRVIPILLVITAVAAFAYFGLPGYVPSSTTHEDIWNTPLQVVDSQGVSSANVTLAQIGGNGAYPIMLELMLSSCSYCQKMAPIMEELYQQYKGSVFFLTVAGTRQLTDDAVTTSNFIKTYGSTWPHVMDQNGKVFSHFGVEGTPTYILFDSTGKVVETIKGEVPKAELASKLASLK